VTLSVTLRKRGELKDSIDKLLISNPQLSNKKVAEILGYDWKRYGQCIRNRRYLLKKSDVISGLYPWSPSPEHRDAIRKAQRKAHLGKPLTPEHRAKLSKAMRGRVLPPEVRSKIATTNRKNTPKGSASPFFGKVRSEEIRHKISEALKGRHVTAEEKQKIRAARLRQVFPQKDTKPERLMQALLTTKGIYFEKHVPLLGQPDLFIPPRLCIFVDGDYWHKLAKQIARDNRVTEGLTRRGYIVLRFWEHEIYNSTDVVWNHINNQINIMTGLATKSNANPSEVKYE